MEIKLEKKIISKLNKIFSDYPKTSKFKNLVDRGYLFSKIESKKVLFVGINPSFTKEAKSENGSFDPIVAAKKIQELTSPENLPVKFLYYFNRLI